MHIDHLTLQNFNRFQNLEMRFDPQFNLLVGDNGAGKTTLLDALAIAAGSWFLGVDSRDARPPKIREGYVRLDPREYESGRFTFEKQYPVRVSASGIVMGEKLTWMREKVSDRSSTRYGNAVEIREVGHRTVSAMRAGDEVVLPLIAIYGTERLWINPGETGSRRARKKIPRENLSRLRGYRNSVGFTIDEDDLFDWIEKETLIGLQSRSESTLFQVVKAAIRDCIEGAIDLYYDVKTDEVVVVMQNRRTQPFVNLSDGQRIMLTMVADLAIKATLLNPQLGKSVLKDTPGIVTIDELDLHLHPRWQRHVIQDLRRTFPSIQFIATSHSPQLIGEVEPREIILLRDHDSVNPPQAYGMDSNWVLRYVMGADERDREVKEALSEIERMIAASDFESARSRIGQMRSLIGNHPDLVRLSARIDRLARQPA
ncbi:MAG TPA: AAA family ATPase [Terracidiphilus sp.]|nr:AAA family ATPase [Terracidiphilus sp.]